MGSASAAALLQRLGVQDAQPARPEAQNVQKALEIALGGTPIDSVVPRGQGPVFSTPGAAPTGGAPSMAGGGSGGIAGLVAAARKAGFSGQALTTAVAVALAESGGVPQKSKYPGEESYGQWQIHMPSHGHKYSRDYVMTPEGGATAAYEISGGGRNWRPWSVYKSGAYQQYLDDAQRAGAY